MRYEAEALYIASIYPGKLDPVRRNYGPSRESTGPNAKRSTLFQLEPVERGDDPFVLQVLDSFQDIASFATGLKEIIPKPVDVQQIVNDLLGRWTGGLFNVPEGARPGIIQIAGTKPTRAELVEMRTFQTAYFEYLFNEGAKLDGKKDWDNITPTMRLGANWLGRDAVWSNPAIAMNTGPCPLCTETIPTSAVYCPRCSNQVGFADGKGGIVRLAAADILARQVPAAVHAGGK